MDVFDLMYELCDVSDYLVMEAEKNSPQMRERVIVRWSTIAASVCLVMAASFFAWRVGMGTGVVDPKDTPGMTDVIGTETKAMAETETDVETDVTGPEPEFESIIQDNVMYHIYDDHAVIVYARNSSPVIVREIVGVPVTDIAEDAFERYDDDKSWVWICAPSDMTFLYDYAVEHGYCFYGIYEDGKPLCYNPEAVSEEDAVEYNGTDVMYDIKYTAPDDNEKIGRLVGEYLFDGSGYDELIETVYFHYVCSSRFVYRAGGVEMAQFYRGNRPSTARVFAEFEDDYNFFERVKYGELDTYDAFSRYVMDHYTESIAKRILGNFLNVNGALYIIEGGSGLDALEYREPEISLTVNEETIVLTAKRKIFLPNDDDEWKFTGEYKTSKFLLVLEDGKWKWHTFRELFDAEEEYEDGTYTLR